MVEAKPYTCPECFGQPLSDRHVRVKRADGDHLEKWPNLCGLCQGEGTVTLDQLVERVEEDQLCEYIIRVQEMGNPQPSGQPVSDDQASDIPF